MTAHPAFYEVWDDQTGNRLGEFATLAEARSLLTSMLHEQGDEAIRSLAVVAFTPQSAPDGDDFAAETVLEGVEMLVGARGSEVTRNAS